MIGTFNSGSYLICIQMVTPKKPFLPSCRSPVAGHHGKCNPEVLSQKLHHVQRTAACQCKRKLQLLDHGAKMPNPV